MPCNSHTTLSGLAIHSVKLAWYCFLHDSNMRINKNRIKKDVNLEPFKTQKIFLHFSNTKKERKHALTTMRLKSTPCTKYMLYLVILLRVDFI